MNLIDTTSYPFKELLPLLLQDKTTKANIIFATDAYSDFGEEYTMLSHITPEKLLDESGIEIVTRVEKEKADQQERTRKNAEVFTPSWVVNRMNNHCDEEWFGHKDVFNVETEDGWITNTEKIEFPKNKTWKKYIDTRFIEIICVDFQEQFPLSSWLTARTIP